jgi:hypothetical protein
MMAIRNCIRVAEDAVSVDHFVSPEDVIRIAMARQ